MYLIYFQNKGGNGQCHGEGGIRCDALRKGLVGVEEKLHRRSNSNDININGNQEETILS